ncbi:MAG TPA: tetratricopeptide repeat protein [Candidatus Angelobacter sp.]|nr:tetratricopeptide repeat protein [Candidatus Angelobacter sp.]
MPRLLYSVLIISFILTSFPSLFAQSGSANGDAMGVYSDIGHPRRQESEFDRNYSDPFPGVPSCLHWPMNAIITSASDKDESDKVAKKARQEFDRGCDATRKKSSDEALKHLDLAVKTDPTYAEAWVLLGQTQKETGKFTEAEQSCTQARQADPKYLPSYLCLADIAAHQEKWPQVADLTNQVIDSHPTKAPSAFYYNSLANFHLSQLDPAEKSGLLAAEQGNDALKGQVYLLLAKIDEQKGDRTAEADHLRKFLKFAPKDPNAGAVRHVLDQIKAETDASASGKPADNNK